MSQPSLVGYYKADIAFYNGYNKLKSAYLTEIIIHFIQVIGLVIFIPIDIVIIQVGDNAIAFQVVAIASSISSLVLLLYQYYITFRKYSLLGYCLMARDLMHITNQQITVGDSQQSCTSEVVLDAPSMVMIESVHPKVIDVYTKMTRNQISLYIEQRFSQIACVNKIEILISLSSMLAIIILMAKSSVLNPAEKAVMVCFLALQAFTKLQFMIGILLIALSPILCLLLLFYICCCAKRQGQSFFDKQAVKALPEDVIKCDGQCAICLQDIKPGQNIYKQLPCSQKHIFHKGCLDNWTKVKLTCPTCRKDLPIKNRQAQLVAIENSFAQPRAA